MRQFQAIFLLLTIMFQSFFNLWIAVYWFSNQSYIATELCEKRQVKNNHCQGKCQLNKKLAEANDTAPGKNEAPKSPSLEKGLELAVFSAPLPLQFSGEAIHTDHERISFIHSPLTLVGVHDIFHPPSDDLS